jgi:hypothetical protein
MADMKVCASDLMALGGLDVQLAYFRNKEGQRSRLCGRADRRD